MLDTFDDFFFMFDICLEISVWPTQCICSYLNFDLFTNGTSYFVLFFEAASAVGCVFGSAAVAPLARRISKRASLDAQSGGAPEEAADAHRLERGGESGTRVPREALRPAVDKGP